MINLPSDTFSPQKIASTIHYFHDVVLSFVCPFVWTLARSKIPFVRSPRGFVNRAILSYLRWYNTINTINICFAESTPPRALSLSSSTHRPSLGLLPALDTSHSARSTSSASSSSSSSSSSNPSSSSSRTLSSCPPPPGPPPPPRSSKPTDPSPSPLEGRLFKEDVPRRFSPLTIFLPALLRRYFVVRFF